MQKQEEKFMSRNGPSQEPSVRKTGMVMDLRRLGNSYQESGPSRSTLRMETESLIFSLRKSLPFIRSSLKGQEISISKRSWKKIRPLLIYYFLPSIPTAAQRERSIFAFLISQFIRKPNRSTPFGHMRNIYRSIPWDEGWRKPRRQSRGSSSSSTPR